ncbi:MAG: hypothetical protein KDB14_04065 [Planctomycetales bacterium]|nr:hypothetical protein [Planctomycetales bacterium]
MATLSESLVSSSSRSVRLRMRPDLTQRQHRYHGQTYWVVKEPVGLNYFRFHEEEYAILCMLDGQTSLEEIKERFEQEFAPQKITFPDLQQFVGMLHRSGLLIAENPGQGHELKRRRDEKKRKELWGKFSNVFAVRFRGIDPDRLLNWLHRYTGWMFEPLFILMFVLFGLSALTLVFVQFDVFRSKLPSFHEFFGPANWIYLGVTMGAVKVIHEFGHGLSCKHYGGECHEMGAMLLVFTPCLYCNVSDSWMLPNKYHRAFIGAAGMYFEVIIASVATYLWWFSEPGLLNQLALSVMFICSVSTVLFNGNPLLRFDGYYILMDLTEIPNLRQKATEVLKRFMVWLCLGIEQPENPFLPQKNQAVFALYTIAAVVYRWVVVFSIMWFLNKILEPYGLKVIGQMIAIAGLFGLVVQPLIHLAKFFYVPGRMHKVKKYRVVLTVLVVAAAAAFVIWVPLPFRVSSVFTLEPRDAAMVYPPNAGIVVLERLDVKAGDEVQAGQSLAQLRSADLLMQREGLIEQRDRVQARLAGMVQEELLDPNFDDSEMPGLEEQIAALETQIKEKDAEIGRLRLTAPMAGTILPPPARSEDVPDDGRLPNMTGSPLDPKNGSAVLSPTEPLCRIGDPRRLEAILIIDQSDIDLVREGAEVELQFDAERGRIYTGVIKQKSYEPLKGAPPALAAQAGGGLETKTDASGMPVPISTSYPAKVDLDDPDQLLVIGMRGKARIKAEPRSLGSRCFRFLSRTFRFEF